MKLLRIYFFATTFLLVNLTCAIISYGDDKPYIAVGSAKAKKSIMAIAPFKNIGSASASWMETSKIINEILVSDLTFTDHFRFISSPAFLEKPEIAGVLPETFKYSDWTSIGVEFLVKSSSKIEGQNYILEGYVYDTFGAKQIFAKRYISATKDSRTLAHTFGNDIVKALTGQAGVFLTKIATSCDRSGKKELYIMDFDGTNVKQITHHRSIAFAPAWSPDSTKIAYSLYTKRKDNVKNIDLYEFDFSKNTVRMLSNRKGINSGAAYSPDGKKIALTMSFLGNPEIFTLEPESNIVTRLTKSMGFDVDPSWSKDGKTMAFVSSRSGMPMVYKMNADGEKVERLTYAGKYNATPSWSPRDNKIAFAGWIDKRFDIFIMNPDGTNIERLTKDQGNNEDPSFSPDGNYIVFSSNRTGQNNIYVMNLDGSFVKRLTYGLGNCVAPKWSAIP